MNDCRSRVWVVSELYYPEETSTGYILTQIAEGLGSSHHVRVLCGQPTYSLRGVKAAKYERRNSVEIHRCWGTTWNRLSLPLRLCNLLTICCSVFFNVLFRVHRQERVLVVTNPPLLPFVVALACRLRGAKCFLLIHDVYPEVAVAAGMMKPDTLAFQILNWCTRWLYWSVAQIIVLGRDMQKLVAKKLDAAAKKTVIITNWADLSLVVPVPKAKNRLLKEAGLIEKFVVQYAGNMGRTHNLEMVLECATRLRHRQDIHFLMIGSGAKKVWLEKSIQERNLTNVSIYGRCPRCELSDFLNACDVSIITFVSGMVGVSVPSRMYNVLAAGKPIVAAVDHESELAQVVEEEQVGWVVPPNDVNAFVNVILEARNNPYLRAEMCLRARKAAEKKYSVDRVIHKFVAVFGGFGIKSAAEPKINKLWHNRASKTERCAA